MNKEKLFLKTILAKEESYQSKYDKIFTGISIELTSEYAGERKITEPILKKTFKPNYVLPIIVLIFAFVILFESIRETMNNNSSNGGVIFGFMFSVMLILMVIKQFVGDTSLNYTITLDKENIIIDDRIILWKNIFTTAIMSVHEGKKSKEYLVIVMNETKSYEAFELTNFISFNFSGFAVTISKYIEYFKLQNNNNA
jgi:hypothetical protein